MISTLYALQPKKKKKNISRQIKHMGSFLSINKTCCNENSYEKENIYNKRMMKHTWIWRRVHVNHMSGVRRRGRIMLWVGPGRTVVLG
jgi:hypothetical protein